MSKSLFADTVIIDADTHLTEPHDLWTSRAPAEYADRVPQVRHVDGKSLWEVDGVILGRAGASGVINVDGQKVRGASFLRWNIEDVHPGAYSPTERLELMDAHGIWAQIVYPNTVGFGGQRFGKVTDPLLRQLSVQLYNDAMAEIQEASGGRLCPMAIVPFWDLELSLKEIERVHDLGLHGLNTTTSPHNHGLPDLGDAFWDPFWQLTSDLGLPVNFHIGAAESELDWIGSFPWPSLRRELKLGLGSAMLYLNNAGVIGNLIYAGVFEKFPKLQVVSVESGVGWVPFFLRALDHQVNEMPAGATDHLSMQPSDYYRRQVHSCFWFERDGIAEAIETLGWDHVMFESDFPHPTCTYPEELDFAAAALAPIESASVRQAIMGGNAARVYGIPVPPPA